jgi:thiol:disulfide interchange protein DsbD
VAGQLAAAAPREGVGAAFWNGVLTTTLATPCTAPFLGPALGVAFTKSAPVVALFFMMVGLGLGLPYIVLAFRPGWLKWLPRPGAWMEIFKQLMGFVLLGTVIWLLWSLTSLTSAQVLMWVLTYLLLVAVASWWLGLALDPARRRPARRVGVVGALALCLVGYFALPERALRASDRLIASGDTPASAVANVTTGDITWEPFAVERIEAETRAGRTVFVDFTAEWCTTCKLNEHGVLATDAVAELFNRHKVLALRADWTRRNELIARILAQFGRSGVPLYVVFPAGRPEAPIVLPTLLRTSDIEKALADAAQATTIARAP